MARQSPLVCQHLENISRQALEKYQQIIRQYVRRRHGVYALYRREKLYYVGLASNLRSRLAHHLKDRHANSWDRFSVYLTIGDSHLRELESLLLRIAKTKGNKQKGRFAKSEDLRGHFARDAKQFWLREMQDLLGLVAPRQRTLATKPTTNGRTPALAKYISGPLTIRACYQGRMYRAFVRKTGLIWFDGKHFTSPSLAGTHLCRNRSRNGWKLWKYQRAPGDWVSLNELRK
jgi:hypothetical protein